MKITAYIYFMSFFIGIIGAILILIGIYRIRKLQKEHNYEVYEEILSEIEQIYQNITIKILLIGSILMFISMIISGIIGIFF
jgi:hypothetical protein